VYQFYKYCFWGLVSLIIGCIISLITFDNPTVNTITFPARGIGNSQTADCGILVDWPYETLEDSNYRVAAGFPIKDHWIDNMADPGNLGSMENTCLAYPNGFGVVFHSWIFYANSMVWSLIDSLVLLVLSMTIVKLFKFFRRRNTKIVR
jgi:hypothetical protein